MDIHWPGCWRLHPECAKILIRRLARIVHQWEPNAKVLFDVGNYSESARDQL